MSILEYSKYIPRKSIFFCKMDVSSIRSKLLRMYYANGNSATRALRAYRRETGVKCQLGECHVRRIVKIFEATYSVNGRRKGSGRPVLGNNEIGKILGAKISIQSSHPYGMVSLRQISGDQAVNVSHTTVGKKLHQLGFHPYKATKVPELLPGDADKRIEFSNEMARFGGNYSNIVWSDEARFNLHCNVQSLHGAIWANKKPSAQIEFPLHSPSITVWMGFSSKLTIPPYFFEGNVNGESYNKMLITHLIPFLKSKRQLRHTYFQQDGAPPHVCNQVKKTLQENFQNRIISRSFEHQWPARSPDLNPLENIQKRFDQLPDNEGRILK